MTDEEKTHGEYLQDEEHFAEESSAAFDVTRVLEDDAPPEEPETPDKIVDESTGIYDEDAVLDEGEALQREVTPEEFVVPASSIWTRVKWGRVALVLIFTFLVLAVSLFVWNRWYRFDDAIDIQGTWRDASTGNTMEVNEAFIKLSEDAVYNYSIDTFAKTISYSFNAGEGFSTYRFSEDRTQLVLEDGQEVDWALVLHFYDDPGFAEGELPEGMVRLEKVSDEIPTISALGSTRPKSPLNHGPSSRLPSSASSSAVSSVTSSNSSEHESDNEEETSSEEKSRPSQTVPDENGLVVSPDRNSMGYYDESGMFVVTSYGHFDEAGEWVDDIGGYYDASGIWIEGPSGYYGFDGVWVDYAEEQRAAQEQEAADTNALAYGSGSDGSAIDSMGYESDATPYETDAYESDAAPYETDAYGTANGSQGF